MNGCRMPQPRVGTIENREVFQQGSGENGHQTGQSMNAAIRSLAVPHDLSEPGTDIL